MADLGVSRYRGVVIQIFDESNPLSRVGRLNANIQFYGAMGNLVHEARMRDPAQDGRVKKFSLWNLENKNGRVVSSGTDLVVAEVTDRNNPEKGNLLKNNRAKFSIVP